MNKKIVTIIFIIAIIALGAWWYTNRTTEIPTPIQEEDTVDTSETLGWQTSSKDGITFKYPATLDTKYISTVDWPPQIAISNDPFVCTTAGVETERAGGTEKVSINGHEYCVTKVSEGAAGSTYTQYAYATVKNNKLAIATFTLRAVQCGNYDAPEMATCETERTLFSMDKTVDLIFGTMEIGNAAVSLQDGTYCYARKQTATTTEPYVVEEHVVLTINGNVVTGTKKGTQSGPDMSNGYQGTLSGTRNGSRAELTYAYTIEGSQNKELEIYDIGATVLKKMRWPLKEQNNILVPAKAGEPKIISYTAETCTL
jgi:hypothetical protein